MTGQHRREVRCPRCGWWWHHPKEAIHFSSWDEWGEEHPEKELLACPNCGVVTEVSEGNVRFAKVSDETFAHPGVSKKTPGSTRHVPGKGEGGKKGARAGK
jgi:uncharacterized C2H2 Zn-finger protein